MKNKFSKLELKIITLICKEHTNKSIASILKRSKRTVEGHRVRIMNKMAVVSIAGLVIYAIRNNIINVKKVNTVPYEFN